MRLLPSLALTSFLICAAAPAALASQSQEDGDAAFARGDYTTAAACFSAALAETPALGANPSFKGQLARAKSGACCEAAERFLASKNGIAALAQVKEAALLDPTWDRPGQLLSKVQAAAAESCYLRAESKADGVHDDEVKKQLNDALALMPTHAKARAALALYAQKPPAGSAWEKAAAAAAARMWDAAEKEWQTVLKENPGHLPARGGLALAHQHMVGARGVLEKARVALQSERRGEAQVLLDQARSEWPGVPFGLALHDEIVAAQAVAAGQAAGPGPAESDYRKILRDGEGSSAIAPTASKEQVAALLSQVDDLCSQGHPGAALIAIRRGRGLSAQVDQKAAALLRDLRQSSLPQIKWVVAGDKIQAAEVERALAAASKSAGGGWEVGVKLITAEASLKKNLAASKTWRWVAEQSEANPDYRKAQVLLDAAEVRRQQAAKEAADQAVRADHPDDCQCALCLAWHASTEQLRQWEQVAGNLATARDQTPKNLTTGDAHDMPYTEENWAAKGRLVVEFTFPYGEPVRSEAVFDKTDFVRLGADPKVGLREHPLALPANEAAIRQDMADRLAKEAMPALILRATIAQAVLLKRSADQAQAQGDASGALELRVKAAAVMGAVAPAFSEKELKALE